VLVDTLPFELGVFLVSLVSKSFPQHLHLVTSTDPHGTLGVGEREESYRRLPLRWPSKLSHLAAATLVVLLPSKHLYPDRSS
jgi:hypothetical protein